MLRFSNVAACGAALLVAFNSAALHAESLTLDRVIALTRARAPDVLIARAQIEEVRGRLAGARPWLAENPIVSGGLGRRRAPGEAGAFEGHLELIQPIEFGGARSARIRAAQAALQGEVARADGAALQAEGYAASAFYRVLAAAERGKVAETAEKVAARSAQALQRRHQLGDVPVLELNVAKMAQARAFARLCTAATAKLQAEADLRLLLGLAPSTSIDVVGDLRDRRRYRRDEIVSRSKDVPGLRALLAELAEAKADGDAGRARRWPKVGLGASYEREEGANVVLGVVSFEIPAFARGQQLTATSDARGRRLAKALEARRVAIATEVHAALDIYEERERAAAALAAALPLADENDDLARKSYEAGQLSLADWLVVRQEALATRLEYIDELLATAEAGIAIAISAGVSP